MYVHIICVYTNIHWPPIAFIYSNLICICNLGPLGYMSIYICTYILYTELHMCITVSLYTHAVEAGSQGYQGHSRPEKLPSETFQSTGLRTPL